MKTSFLTAIFIGVLVLTGCNPVKSTAEADKAAAKFHSLFDAEDFEQIFVTAHADFQASQPKEDTIHFLRSVREKLGSVKSTNRTGWLANSVNMKTNVVLTFETEFENGQGVETFTYRIADGSAILLGWHINSDALIVTPIKGEQAGAAQPATRSESDLEGGNKAQPEAEERSR